MIDDFAFFEIKTKVVVGILVKFDLKDGLIVDGKDNGLLCLFVCNLFNFKFLVFDGVNVYDVLCFFNLVFI